MERRIARRTVLRLELADELVEAGLVRHMGARKLQYPLAAQRVLERLFTHSALAADKGALPPGATSVCCHHRGGSADALARLDRADRGRRAVRRRANVSARDGCVYKQDDGRVSRIVQDDHLPRQLRLMVRPKRRRKLGWRTVVGTSSRKPGRPGEGEESGRGGPRHRHRCGWRYRCKEGTYSRRQC